MKLYGLKEVSSLTKCVIFKDDYLIKDGDLMLDRNGYVNRG